VTVTRGPHDQGADGDVRHKMAVHYVNMDNLGAGRLHRPYFLAETRKISGKNRWCNHHLVHSISLNPGRPEITIHVYKQ